MIDDQEYRSNSDHENDFIDDAEIAINAQKEINQLRGEIDSPNANMRTPVKAGQSPLPVSSPSAIEINSNPLAEYAESTDIIQEFDLRRDPEEEFFMLAVLAQKMSHTEQNEDSTEFIYEISA